LLALSPRLPRRLVADYGKDEASVLDCFSTLGCFVCGEGGGYDCGQLWSSRGWNGMEGHGRNRRTAMPLSLSHTKTCTQHHPSRILSLSRSLSCCFRRGFVENLEAHSLVCMGWVCGGGWVRMWAVAELAKREGPGKTQLNLPPRFKRRTATPLAHDHTQNQTSSGIDQTSIGIGQTSTGIYQTSIGIDHTSKGIDQSSTGINQTFVGMDQTSIGIAQTSTWIDQTSTWIDQTSIWIDQTFIGIDQTGIGIDQTYTGIDQTSIWINQTSKGIDQTYTGIDQTSIGKDQTSMWINQN